MIFKRGKFIHLELFPEIKTRQNILCIIVKVREYFLVVANLHHAILA